MVQSAVGAVPVASLLPTIGSLGPDPDRNPWRQYVSLAQSALTVLHQGDLSRATEILEELVALAQGSGGRGPSSVRYIQERMQRVLDDAPSPIALDPARVLDLPRTVVAEPATEAHWVRVQALGGFELSIAGRPLTGGLKPQRRPLELLKMLLVAGEPISAEQLADVLWPDSEGDTARNCLQVAVHRLRRLLACEQAIVVKDRKLHLDSRLCWVDAWAFQSEWDSLKRVRRNDPTFPQRAVRALQLYRGHLFCQDAEQPWMLAARERLRRSWLGLVRRIGDHHEGRREWLRAVDLYERALDIDPVAEALYRRLMVCQHNAGERAEAMHTYSRCRDQLSSLLGIAPSADTEQLYQYLRSGG
jgi:LuxR family transcriptional regulator, maltose regulon positive regulatory protein